MKLHWVVGVACLLVLSAFVTVRAEDKPADQKKDYSKARLTQPWSKLSDLSDEQKAKVKEIHGKANDDVKAIREKEQADIMALLNDGQKKEAQKMIDESATKKPAKSAATDKPEEKKDEPKKEEPAKG